MHRAQVLAAQLAADSRREQLGSTPTDQCTRQCHFDNKACNILPVVCRSIFRWSCYQNPAMSYNLSSDARPFPSTPSETSTIPLFSDNSGHEELDISQSSQSSRIVTVNNGDSDQIQNYRVISKIEEIFASMVDVLAEGGDALVIPYRRRTAQREEGVLRFPGSTVQEAIKFS